MSREAVRHLKRSLRAGNRPGAAPAQRALSSDSALALLARSIRFGHGRLAVLRLCMAVEAGATVPPEYWNYCARAVHASNDVVLQDLYRRATAGAACCAEAVSAGP